MMGPVGAVAVLNSDLGAGIRMAVPLAMLSSLTLCASKGILVKDGRALEMMNQVDTVLFDKTGTLTRERPEVGRVIAADGWQPDQILGFAAAAELCDLRDLDRDLDRNVNRSWSMIVAPNVTNVIGVFTMGFGIMTSVITNNVSALFALGNGLLAAAQDRAGRGRPPARSRNRHLLSSRFPAISSRCRRWPRRRRSDTARSSRAYGIGVTPLLEESTDLHAEVAEQVGNGQLFFGGEYASCSVGSENMCEPALVVKDNDDCCPCVEVLRHLCEHLRPAVRRRKDLDHQVGRNLR